MPAPTLVPTPLDRLLLIHDVRARLPQVPTADGTTQCAVSDRWIREHVAPNKRRRIGRAWAVAERDFAAWHARWVAGTLTPAELPTRARTDTRKEASRAA